MTITTRLAYDRAVERGTENDPNPTIMLAEHGHFSDPFFRRVRFALEIAPGVVRHVVTLRTATGGQGDAVQATREAPLPFNQQAWDDANHLYATLVYWSRALAPELHLQPPTVARRAWMNGRGKVVGLPANISPDQARYVAGVMATWLRIQIEPIMWLDPEDITEFAANVGDVFRVNARWPQREHSRKSGMQCPRCGDDSGERLTIYAPEVARGHTTYYCQACGLTLNEDEFTSEVHRLGSRKTAHHLVTKYGVQIPGEWRA